MKKVFLPGTPSGSPHFGHFLGEPGIYITQVYQPVRPRGQNNVHYIVHEVEELTEDTPVFMLNTGGAGVVKTTYQALAKELGWE